MTIALTSSDSLNLYIQDINKLPLLQKEEEFKLASRYRDQADLSAAEKLVTSNLRFVVKIANEFRRYGLNMKDLIQEGNVGLMVAVKKFDPSKGFRLISYAVWWIRAYIHNYIMRSWSMVKMGTTAAQRKLFFKLRAAKNQVLLPGQSLDEESSLEIAKMLDLPAEDVLEMDERLSSRDFSLNTNMNDESDNTFLEMVPSTDNPSEMVLSKDSDSKVGNALKQILPDLDEREELILKERLMSDDEITLQEIGNRFGISRERARQLENRLKKKLKEHLKDFHS